MKKTASLLGVALLMVCASMAMAGDFHSGATLICSDCHVMHYSQTHGYNNDGTGITTPLGTSGPYHFLLRNDINDLCLTCHDGQAWAPDVLGPNTGAHARQGGTLNRPGTGNAATGHTLDSTDPAPLLGAARTV
jgi:cytochrome c2